MARVSLILSALTAGAILAASPLASATNSEPAAPQPLPVQTVQEQLPAESANMLSMSMCGDRDQVLTELAQQFREKPMAVGQVDGNAVVEILVSETGSWTILATGTDGQSCIVSAGEGFESTTLVRGIDA
ncbi:hypothetical protein [Mesorhizobium sp. CAU 1741]|uniref:hypothetical protein n=1 Tax=Mesorhizobium sp. CAU 1741 TaxID=3140366 RepID=UPI00325AC237